MIDDLIENASITFKYACIFFRVLLKQICIKYDHSKHIFSNNMKKGMTMVVFI